VIQRRTQTESYWRDQLSPTTEDASLLYERILDAAKPLPMEALTKAVIERHCRKEERLIEAELSKGRVYQPRDRYDVGEYIIFPALDYALGKVVGTRLGRNPDYGEFTVVQVVFAGDDDVREFASGLEGAHKLNGGEGGGAMLGGGDLLPPEELYERYGALVETKLIPFLEGHADFVSFGGQWFLRGLLVEIGIGHLNIAEALIEIRAMPLSGSELAKEIGLPQEVSPEVKLFSLSAALEVDPRFDNVGDSGRDIWYLRRLTPASVVTPPARLRLEIEPYNRQVIAQELLLIEREIDDEGSGEAIMGPSRPIYRTTIALIYPHWRAGTLPLTVRTQGLFPQATTHHTPIVLVDGQAGTKMQGWVVHEAAVVYGLGDWYRRHDLPVGAFIKLERTRDPRIITVDFEPRRLKRLWAPVATAKDGTLVFQMRKLPIMCEYDEHLTISEDRPQAIDDLWEHTHARKDSLFQIMLSPQSTVHAKTIYSAVNVLKRTPPGPVFAQLSTEPCFVAMGGGYWTFDGALVRR
jgi:hypothetical protein